MPLATCIPVRLPTQKTIIFLGPGENPSSRIDSLLEGERERDNVTLSKSKSNCCHHWSKIIFLAKVMISTNLVGIGLCACLLFRSGLAYADFACPPPTRRDLCREFKEVQTTNSHLPIILLLSTYDTPSVHQQDRQSNIVIFLY